jgi:hypothetical protein
MTQRIFDVENEKDMADLWDILPDKITKITKPEIKGLPCFSGYDSMRTSDLIGFNWHNKTEITRPIQECTEQDIGKICVFYDRFDETDDEPDIYAVLHKIENQGNNTWYYTERGDYYAHCRRLTKQEIEELC